MTIHSDIPTRSQIERLLIERVPASVSIYLPTTRATLGAQSDRVVLSNLSESALAQLREHDIDDGDVGLIGEAVDALVEDDEFWTR